VSVRVRDVSVFDWRFPPTTFLLEHKLARAKCGLFIRTKQQLIVVACIGEATTKDTLAYDVS
jgi:hypothetical protein